MSWLSFELLDVFIPRGNRPFGGGVHGEALMPPWPSVFAGALASKALADAGEISRAVADPEGVECILEKLLGPDHGVLGVGLLKDDRPLFPVPADLVVLEGPRPVTVRPRSVEGVDGLASSAPTPRLPVLTDPDRAKPQGGYWIRLDGLKEHLGGGSVSPEHLVYSGELWKLDPRLGIALDRGSRTVAEGLLYTTDAVRLLPGVRILVGFRSSRPLADGLVRIGGDGRAAQVTEVSNTVQAAMETLGTPGAGWPGFRMILATPGLFPTGWLPPGVSSDGILRFQGLEARLEAASVGRFQVVSGWDLARQRPKPAQRAVPQGSVYWFSVRSGDTSSLEALHRQGLWPLVSENKTDAVRRREGYNRVWFGYWDPKEE